VTHTLTGTKDAKKLDVILKDTKSSASFLGSATVAAVIGIATMMA
jgi:hypothetical protein